MIAKAPVAGRVKTRLCPPCTARQAARLAGAALRDTITAVDGVTGRRRRILCMDGSPDGWLPPGWEAIQQRAGGLDERLAGAFRDVAEPALLIGMDTPQVTPELLASCARRLEAGDRAVVGPATDGGFWAIGLRTADPRVFTGVPMSTGHTLRSLRRRLGELRLPWRELPSLRDVDTFADAAAVAALATRSGFARTFSRIGAELDQPWLAGTPR